MPSNPYFRQFRVRSEQNLVDDLIKEVIQIHGVDLLYLPRTTQKLDLIYGEDILSKFDDYYDLEMYYKSQAFEGAQEHISKFGLQLEHRITLVVSKTRFDQATNYELDTPKEGDLIFDPPTNSLWEIKFVNKFERWFQLGDLPIYELEVTKFEFGQEQFDTGIAEIDQIETDYSRTLLLKVTNSVGNFLDNEIVFQGTSLANSTASGEVALWDYTKNELKLINIKGVFDTANGIITGATSGTTKTLDGTPDQLADNDFDLSNNRGFVDESQGYLDFSESDIFGFLKN
jgi:hypothetical protein